jgi:hypothetical protein
MKLKGFSVIFFALLLIMAGGCSNDSSSSSTDPTLAGDFWGADFVKNQWYRVTTGPVYTEGTYCKIYVEEKFQKLITKSAASAIAAEYDNTIYPLMTNMFGSVSDVNTDGKVTILILDIKDGWTASGGYIAGYFDSTNEWSTDTNPHSNAQEMLYMDCSPGTASALDSTFCATMAHETQHMINFNQKVFVQNQNQQDTWLNEGLSAAAEYEYNGQQTDKIAYYNNTSTNAYIGNGLNFLNWGRYSQDTLGYYSTVYLFFQWLRIHGTDAIYKEILDNPNSDYMAVQEVCTAKTAWSGYLWKDIIRSWFIANLFNAPSGSYPNALYGYKGEISLTPRKFTGSTATLFPGEGVYVAMSGSCSITPSSPLDYAGLTTGTLAVDTGSSHSGNVLLAYNYNGNKYGLGYITGALPSVVASKSSKISTLNADEKNGKSATLTKPQPIDKVLNSNDTKYFDESPDCYITNKKEDGSQE